ncbi:MAG: maleylpyruvate isomerase family mycothiol-dependent enzyme [Actinomycetota bacterium]
METAAAVELTDTTTRRIAHRAATADMTAPAVGLGRWRVQDVVAHLGGVHEWATRVVRTGTMDGPGFRKSKLRGPELADWYGRVAAELVDTLRDADPSEPCDNFNPGSASTNTFWIRRQLHESLIHAYDIDRAVGDVVAIPIEAAADGIDEYLDVFVRTRGKQTLSAPLGLRITDGDRRWALAPAAKPGRIDVDPIGAEPVATIAGPAMELSLVLWSRLTVAEAQLEVVGDPAVASSFRE